MSANFATLTGHFVDLRPLQLEDAEVTLAWRLGARARLMNAGATTVSDQRRWIGTRPESERNYVIALKSGLPVGMLSLIAINHTNRNAEPSRFLIGDEQAARGLPVAVEAMALLYEEAFDSLQLSRLYGLVADSNALMLKWQKYLGMREEGRMRRHYHINGLWQDAVMVGLLEEEYRTVTVPRIRSLIAMTDKGFGDSHE